MLKRSSEAPYVFWRNISIRSSLGRDPVGNFVVLGLRHDAPRHQFAGFVIGTPGNHPVRLRTAYTRQAQQLLFGGRVQVKRLVAIPAFAYSLRHSLGIALHFGSRLRGFLLQFLRALFLSATHEYSQQEKCWKVSKSDEVHICSALSAVLDDTLPSPVIRVVKTEAISNRQHPIISHHRPYRPACLMMVRPQRVELPPSSETYRRLVCLPSAKN